MKKISNGKIEFNISYIGRNDGCAFCGNEKSNLYDIGNDNMSFEEISGMNCFCKKCLPLVILKYGFYFL